MLLSIYKKKYFPSMYLASSVITGLPDVSQDSELKKFNFQKCHFFGLFMKFE